MKRIESFRWWINDYLTSTVRRRCSLEARGAYLDILMLLYSSPRPGYACESINGELRYLDPEEILTDIGQPDGEPLWSELAQWGAMVRDDDGWYNAKAVEVAENEIDFRAKKAAAGAKGGRARAKNLAKGKQCSSSAASSALAEGVANGYPPDPDSDPDPDTESEPEPKDTDTPRVCAREEPKPRPPLGTNDAVLSVVEAWRLAWDSPDYQHGLSDTIAVNDALADGWTVEQLCESMRGWTNDDWGKRKFHNSIPKLLAHVQKGIDLGKKQTGPLTLADIGRGGPKP